MRFVAFGPIIMVRPLARIEFAVCLLLGLLVSTVAATQLAAILISLLLIVPSIYFSGLAFPIESMPAVLQYISGIVPARWFVEAARMIFLKGSRLADLLPHFAALLAAGCLLGLWAVGSYRKR